MVPVAATRDARLLVGFPKRVVPVARHATRGCWWVRSRMANSTTAVWQPDKLIHERLKRCNPSCAQRWQQDAEHQRAKVASALRNFSSLDVLLDARAPSERVQDGVFGANLEVTRRSIFAGLSAQLIANRVFASHDGVWVPRWTQIGNASLGPPGVSVSGAVGSHAIRCLLREGAPPCGVEQGDMANGWSSAPGAKGSGIPILAGREYSLRLVMRSDRPVEVTVLLRTPHKSGPVEPSAHAVIFSHTYVVGGSRQDDRESNANPARAAAWRTHQLRFVAAISSSAATLQITSTFTRRLAERATVRDQATGDAAIAVSPAAMAQRVPEALLEVSAVSLMPSDHVDGMRRDVIEQLARIGLRGPIRWPGGCFSSIQPDWRDGLRPHDERPPFRAPPDGWFCVAAEAGVLGLTDGFAINHPNVRARTSGAHDCAQHDA